MPGESISKSSLHNADILITRTITEINAALLENTAVKFVGTATTGTDHIDLPWLVKNNIACANAAGANAKAVAEYVLCCLVGLKKHGHLTHHKTVGIIGCGRIGQIVAKWCQQIGFKVICYDPLIDTETLPFHFTSLEILLQTADIITLHTPLTKTNPHPTFHMIDQHALQKIKPNAFLLNTARGSVIDQSALLHADHLQLCLDVWENEPHLSLELLNKTLIATPHIAGYSRSAKYRATEMVYEQAANYFGWPKKSADTKTAASVRNLAFHDGWENAALSVYDPFAHTKQFRGAFLGAQTEEEIKAIFMRERKNYVWRGDVV